MKSLFVTALSLLYACAPSQQSIQPVSAQPEQSTKGSQKKCLLAENVPRFLLETEPPWIDQNGRLTQAGLMRGLAPIYADARACKPGYVPDRDAVVTIRMSIAAETGDVNSASPLNLHGDTAIGKCVADAAKKAIFLPFEGSTAGAVIPFIITSDPSRVTLATACELQAFLDTSDYTVEADALARQEQQVASAPRNPFIDDAADCEELGAFLQSEAAQLDLGEVFTRTCMRSRLPACNEELGSLLDRIEARISDDLASDPRSWDPIAFRLRMLTEYEQRCPSEKAEVRAELYHAIVEMVASGAPSEKTAERHQALAFLRATERIVLQLPPGLRADVNTAINERLSSYRITAVAWEFGTSSAQEFVVAVEQRLGKSSATTRRLKKELKAFKAAHDARPKKTMAESCADCKQRAMNSCCSRLVKTDCQTAQGAGLDIRSECNSDAERSCQVYCASSK